MLRKLSYVYAKTIFVEIGAYELLRESSGTGGTVVAEKGSHQTVLGFAM